MNRLAVTTSSSMANVVALVEIAQAFGQIGAAP